MSKMLDLFKNKEESGGYRFMTRNISRSGTATIGIHEVKESNIPLLENIWEIAATQDGYYPLLVIKMPEPLSVSQYTLEAEKDLKELHNIDLEEQIIKILITNLIR